MAEVGKFQSPQPNDPSFAVRYHHGDVPYYLHVQGKMLVLSGPKDVILDRLKLARLIYENAERQLAAVPYVDVSISLPLPDLIP